MRRNSKTIHASTIQALFPGKTDVRNN